MSSPSSATLTLPAPSPPAPSPLTSSPSSSSAPAPSPPTTTPPATVFARGLHWPAFCSDWESRLDSLADFEPRVDDVFVISFPKCGHHWSHEFLTMILNGRIEMPKGMKGDNFLEYRPTEEMEGNPSPRLILTHLPFQFLPKKILERRNKVVRIMRNPKDVCISYYNHLVALKMYNYSGPLSHYLELFLEGKNQYGSFFAWESRYKDELGGDDRRDHVFHTSFEALKAAPAGTMKSLGEFLGLKRSDDFYSRVAEETAFEKVKAARDQHDDYKPLYKEGGSLYRKGQVGDWVNHLTVAQSRRIDEKGEEYRLQFVYEL